MLNNKNDINSNLKRKVTSIRWGPSAPPGWQRHQATSTFSSFSLRLQFVASHGLRDGVFSPMGFQVNMKFPIAGSGWISYRCSSSIWPLLVGWDGDHSQGHLGNGLWKTFVSLATQWQHRGDLPATWEPAHYSSVSKTQTFSFKPLTLLQSIAYLINTKFN